MTIAITGQKKYDFQDRTCIAIMLHFYDYDNAEFFVEREGCEDGVLHLNDQHNHIVEIQVKGADKPVTMDFVVECLAHMPDRFAKDTLLEKLIENDHLYVVLVMTGRCDDETSIYTHPWGWKLEAHKSGKVQNKNASILLDNLASAKIYQSATPSKLMQERAKHCNDLSGRLTPANLAKILHRLIVIERTDDETINSTCCNILQQKHHVPQDQHENVLLKLYQAVKDAKDTKKIIDAFPLVRTIIDDAKPAPVLLGKYVLRGDEDNFHKILATDNVLLLSGSPRTGKTFLARKLATDYQSKGYNVLLCNDIEEAERFLYHTSHHPRLAFLDDPFGGTQLIANPIQALTKLKQLTTTLSSKRKLIVAQSQDQLLLTTNKNKIEDVCLHANSFFQSKNYTSTFLVNLWQSLCDTYTVDPTLKKIVIAGLQNNDIDLEPGCLNYLAINHHELDDNYALENIIRHARTDAKDLSLALTNNGYEQLLLSLAITSSTMHGIDEKDLAFILCDNVQLPEYEEDCHTFSFGAGIPKGFEPPCYDKEYTLSEEHQSQLDDLEKRSIINIDDNGTIRITHAFYQSAAELTLENPSTRLAKKIINITERGLRTKTPITSRSTARNLHWVYTYLGKRLKQQEELLKLAESGLKSFFPATRDLCFDFLLNPQVSLNDGMQKDLQKWVNRVSFHSLDNITWVNGEAVIDTSHSTDSFFRQYQHVDKGEVIDYLQTLERNSETFLTPEQIEKILRFYSAQPDKISHHAVKTLLSNDVAVIRSEVTRIWLSITRIDDNDILVRIFQENHPSVALAVLNATIVSWETLTQERQNKLIAGLIQMSECVSNSIAMMNPLVIFERTQEKYGVNPPWPVFEAIMPIVISKLPINASFSSARMFNVFREAVPQISINAMLAICDSWMGYLESHFDNNNLPSEFSLGVAEILISTTKKRPEKREKRIERLLSVTFTAALMAIIRDLVNDWQHLATDEKKALTDTLTDNRTDKIWLQAIAITRENVPPSLQKAILGTQFSLDDSPNTILEMMEPSLLNASVKVFCGNPQPLWWIGCHHNSKEWEPIIELIARTPEHELFELAWSEITFNGNGKRVANVINDVGVKYAEIMLHLLLKIKLDCTGHFMPEAWTALFSLAPNKETKQQWFEMFDPYLPAILDEPYDIKLWLSDEEVLKLAIEMLKEDFYILKICGKLLKSIENNKTSLVSAYIKRLDEIFNNYPPRLFGTCDYISRILKNLPNIPHEFSDAVQAKRKAILDDMHDDSTKPKLKFDDITDWSKSP